ncbi:MraY family glycosyltransferase [Galbitalea soli]|uniref:Undecaprenyl/decaprenyl-phosphate alpha-N-acetylglucosaminyl 1-phosphate transferase n=1 Tax=Galbitalea soli TaxID=1268042 RepID=A0A7C9TQ91_9MICO|nr:MraY family glycosyltransferase [Galbitalea soli]NEM90464.1 undecaprenyl/decaprenyl-phosphate alpha-N-acetylglucosaminyl 1-phosphate transferase [Galbitalea soli]NYJ31176.1 UDP-GlcNAc:undecaprenyl-phosphate GlcNAc-1-phosphate transferase [Galbitalea soli]
MRIIFYVLTTVVAAAVTWALSVLILRLSHRYRLYPKIRSRDVHTRPTPRLGGVAMFFGVLVGLGVASFIPQLKPVFSSPENILAVVAAAFIIVVMGVVDDIWDLDWVTKLAGQIIAAGVLAFGGIQITSLPIGGIILISPLTSLILTIFAVVLVMNAVNFVDGLDGLVAGVAIIANGVFFIFSYLQQAANNIDYFNLASLLTAVLIGACLGFLPVNFHPAKMFMGDAGALLVGLLMAATAIAVTGQIDPISVENGTFGHGDLLPAFIPILLPVAILVIPLLDFGLAVFRRLRAGKSPFSADRKHLHHRLLDMGHSHLHAVLIFYAWTAVASVGVLMFLFVPWYWGLAIIVTGLVVTTVFTLAPLSRRKREEAAAQSAPAVAAGASDPAIARLDPLDAAAADARPLAGADPTTLTPKEGAAS